MCNINALASDSSFVNNCVICIHNGYLLSDAVAAESADKINDAVMITDLKATYIHMHGIWATSIANATSLLCIG